MKFRSFCYIDFNRWLFDNFRIAAHLACILFVLCILAVIIYDIHDFLAGNWDVYGQVVLFFYALQSLYTFLNGWNVRNLL